MAEADKSRVGLCGLAVMGQVSLRPIRYLTSTRTSPWNRRRPEKIILTAALYAM